MAKKKEKKNRKRTLVVLLLLLLLLGIGALVVLKVFTVEHVVVKGNELYDDEVISRWVLDDEYSWNTLYVYLKYRFREPETIPFVDTMEVSMRLPHTIEIQVYEKGLLGYVEMESVGQNVYFDKDGIVVETSSERIEGLPRIEGLSVDSVVLYEKLPIKGKSVLKNLLALTQLLKKYQVVPDTISYGEDMTYRVEYGSIRVLLGNAVNFDDKVVRLAEILPRLQGQAGTLHLESWTENNTEIRFQKDP